MKKRINPPMLYVCGFCGRYPKADQSLHIGNAGGMICDDCIDAMSLIREDKVSIAEAENLASITPKEIKEALDMYVIGQEKTKKVLSVAMYVHSQRIRKNDANETLGISPKKNNILLIGPTGAGKTYFMQVIAKLFDIPLFIADASSLSESGYVGEDPESIIKGLYYEADKDLERAQFGIIYVDEIDSIFAVDMGSTRDVSGKGVQKALLKIIEGKVINFKVPAGGKVVKEVSMNTKNILFVCGGSFSGLEEIVSARVAKSSIGFGSNLVAAENNKLSFLKNTEVQDIEKFGFAREFLGRLPVISVLDELKESELVQILTEPEESLVETYQTLFAENGIALEFTEEALQAVAQEALKRKTGARGLQSILEDCMLDIMYELFSESGVATCTITKASIADRVMPDLIMSSNVIGVEG